MQLPYRPRVFGSQKDWRAHHSQNEDFCGGVCTRNGGMMNMNSAYYLLTQKVRRHILPIQPNYRLNRRG